ncbi:MAG: hypothetical protein ACK5V6_13235, partial [Pseudanabaena sp.]
SDRVDITVSPPTIQDEGVVIAARSTLNFIGTNVTATDNSESDRVDVNISFQGLTKDDWRLFYFWG